MWRVGDPVPMLQRRIELVDMVTYAGATWDFHRLHYDPAYYGARGLERPVVDGQYFGALLALQLREWLGAEATLTRLHFRFKHLVFAGETIRCVGHISAISPTELTLTQQVEVVDDGRVAVAPAGATVRLTPPAAG